MESQKITFVEFIDNLLKQGGVGDDNRAKLLSPNNIEKLQIAFTHESYTVDKAKNYEYYEFLGDTIVNQFLALYTIQRFSKIVNIGWLTKIKHMFQSKKALSKIAHDNGFVPYIRFDPNKIPIKKKEKPDWYISILEDVLEAFCGCIVSIFEDEGYGRIVGIAVVNNILRPFFDKIDVPLEYKKIADAVSRLKELYESTKMEPKVGSKNPRDVYRIFRSANPPYTYTVRVYGWPAGFDQENPMKNRILIGVTMNENEELAKQEAAEKGLKEMKEGYGKFLPDPDPYKPGNPPEVDMKIPPSFKDFIELLLVWGDVEDDVRKKMLDTKYVKMFYISFTHKSEGVEDQEYFKFIGNPIVNCFLAYATKKRMPAQLKHGWATRIQHTLRNKRMLAAVLSKYSNGDIEKYMRYKKENIPPQKLLSSTWYATIIEGAFDAVCGCIVKVMEDLGYPDVAGINIANNLTNYFFPRIHIPLDYDVLFDPVSRLKELYENRKFVPPIGELGMKMSDVYEITEVEEDDKIIYTVKVYGWPEGYSKFNPLKNKVLLATNSSIDKDEAKHAAANMALRILKIKYGKILPPQNPYI